MNLDHYKSSKEALVELVLKQKVDNILEAISLISIVTHTPVIAVSFFVGERLGWPQDILDSIRRLEQFYGYKDIESIPESYPREKM